MKKLLESARIASEAAKDAIAEVRERFAYPQPEYEMADDAYLGIGLAVKRLGQLESHLGAVASKPGPGQPGSTPLT
jgi:hypothetical protein